jgi:hypothetical protein
MNPRPSNKEIRRIVDWAKPYGWELLSKKDGNGHWVLRHAEHGVVRLPETPGEIRGLANARADIRRKSGIPNDSGPAGRYRHEGRRNGFDMDAALKERRIREAAAQAEQMARYRRREAYIAERDEKMALLVEMDPRRENAQAKALARRVQFLNWAIKNS